MLDFGPGSFFLTPSHLSDSPSSRHGIPSYTEKALRLYACEIIQEAGILLRLPQAVAATAQVLLHRFFCKQSFRDFDARSAAASCFWLSMKLEEEEGASNRGRKPSQLDDVVAMFENIRARREGDLPLLQHSVAFKRRKEELLKLETRILVELGFVCHVEHPHKILLGYLNSLGSSRELVQEAWNMLQEKWACCHGSAYCAGTLEGKLLGKMQPGYRIACNWSLCWDSMASLKSYTYPYLISAMLNHATWP